MADASNGGRRHVAVPMPIFKAVTVFTTLFAVFGIIVGFALIDRGTNRARAAPEEINVALTLLGIGFIIAAALLYVFSTRFTPAERANDKGESSQRHNDG